MGVSQNPIRSATSQMCLMSLYLTFIADNNKLTPAEIKYRWTINTRKTMDVNETVIPDTTTKKAKTSMLRKRPIKELLAVEAMIVVFGKLSFLISAYFFVRLFSEEDDVSAKYDQINIPNNK